jgi:DNA-binding NarL/FixJ family response regulator
MLRVLIADDHELVRLGMAAIIRIGFGEVVIGQASDGQQAVKLLQAEAWDLALLDINMPGMGGLELLRVLRQQQVKFPIIMVSMHVSAPYIMGSLKAGAAGFVTKNAVPEELLEAIRKVLAGERFLSSDIRPVVGDQN